MIHKKKGELISKQEQEEKEEKNLSNTHKDE